MCLFEPPPHVTSVLHFMGFLKLLKATRKGKEVERRICGLTKEIKVGTSSTEGRALTSCANPSSKVQL